LAVLVSKSGIASSESEVVEKNGTMMEVQFQRDGLFLSFFSFFKVQKDSPRRWLCHMHGRANINIPLGVMVGTGRTWAAKPRSSINEEPTWTTFSFQLSVALCAMS
jgi:hypothetical protein